MQESMLRQKIACAHSQRYTEKFSLLIGPNDAGIKVLPNFPPAIGPNVISGGPANRLSIR